MSFIVGVGLDGITSISTVLLASLGLYVIYGQMKVINMAHGDLMMIGAYSTALAQANGVPFFWAVALATIVGGFLGLLIEVLVVRHLYGRQNLSTLLATWGVSLCLVETMRLTFGPNGRYVDAPTSTTVNVLGSPYPVYSFLLVLAVLVLVGCMFWIFQKSNIGLKLRATQEDPLFAELNGIDIKRLYRWTFVMGSSLAALAGSLLSPISAVTPQMGLDYSSQSFLVVITGGFSNLLSPILGSVLVGGSHSILNSYLGVTRATIGMLAMAAVVLFLRPQGMAAR